MFHRFTDRARKVMALANQEAQRFDHGYIRTEDVLLGLVKEGHGAGIAILKNFGIDLKELRMELEKLVKSGPDMAAMEKQHQITGAKKVIEHAIEESRELKHNYVGTEHILLGLLWETNGVASKSLRNKGLRLKDTRQEVSRIFEIGKGLDYLNDKEEGAGRVDA
jgi:ATP-dependent Clp protease ATP-binding subunit ClpC